VTNILLGPALKKVYSCTVCLFLFRALIDTSGVPQEVKPYLPLFAAFLSKLGAKHLSYQALDTEIELNTGMFSHSHSICSCGSG
jgi:Zn-dependent M16 (insulinase) family peptidase